MTHPPQEILLKVMCSECGGSGHSPKYEVTDIDPIGGEIYSEVDAECNSCQATGFTYEPATRVVLTVEELEELLSDARSEGYSDGATDPGNHS